MKIATLKQLIDQAKEATQQHDIAAAIQFYTAVLDESDAKTDSAEEVQLRLDALRWRSMLQRRLGKQEAAMGSLQQMRQEARTDQQIATSTEWIAQQYSSMGQHDKAMGLHREALQLAEKVNYTYGRALALQGWAYSTFYLGRYEESLSLIEKALSLFRQIDNVPEKLRTWNLLGIVRSRQGELDKSIAAFQQALVLAREIGEWDIAVCLTNLGESYQFLYDMPQALVYHQEALALAEKINQPMMEVDLHRNLGVEMCYLGQVKEGIASLRQSLRLSEVVGQPFLTYQVLYSLAQAEYGRGHIDKAEEYAQRLFDLAEQNNTRDFRAQAMHVLGLCAQSREDLLTAEQLWQQALFLAHETGQQTLLWQLHACLAKIAPNPALAQTHYRIAAEVIEQMIYPIEDENLRQTFRTAQPVQAVLDEAAKL